MKSIEMIRKQQYELEIMLSVKCVQILSKIPKKERISEKRENVVQSFNSVGFFNTV